MPVNRNEITNGAMLSDALEQGMNTGELAARFDGAPCIMKRSIAGCFPYCAGKMIRPPGKFVGRKSVLEDGGGRPNHAGAVRDPSFPCHREPYRPCDVQTGILEFVIV